MMKRITVFLYTICVALSLSAQGSVVFKAKLDSATLLMGKQVAIHIDLSQGKDVQGILLEDHVDTLNAYVEIAARPEADTIDIENNRINIKRDLIIQSFDSGVYVLPPLRYVVGRDTFESERLSLKVMPVNVDTLVTVHGYKPVEEAPFKLFDWVPSFISDYWWVYALIVAVILIGLFVYFKWLRNGEIPLLPKKKRLPPYEEAIERLGKLKEKHLWQSGQEKAYYTELTDILRVYIKRRLNVSAEEMTTGQILQALKGNEITATVNDQLASILELADFVKFANMRPAPDENEVMYQRSLKFVNDTKPEEQPEEGKDGETKAEDANAAVEAAVKEDKEVKK